MTGEPGENEGSVMLGALWMVGLSLILFWLPGIGPILAGLVGGKKAGGVGAALLAVLVPSLLLGFLFFVFAGLLTAVPVIGIVAGAVGMLLPLVHVGPLLLGAIIGGLLA